MTLQGNVVKWFGVRLTDGAILCDLEGITYSELPATIGQYESATVNLTIQATATTPASGGSGSSGTPVVLSGSVGPQARLTPTGTDPAWVDATLPGGAALIAYVDQPGTSTPVILWGGMVTQRVRTKSNVVQLSLVTPEYYFQACYVGAYSSGAVNQDTILSQLVTQFGAGTNQIQWVLNRLTASTQTQTVNYLAGNNTTLYKALQDLSAVAGGPEWFCDWQYTPASDKAPATCLPRVNYGARIGTPAPSIGPYVTIEPDDCLEFQLLEDYTSGKGANQVTAYGRANNQTSGGAPPTGVQPSTWVASGRPQWQYTYAVDTTSDPNVLLANASQALTRLQNGTSAVTAVLPIGSIGKQYGTDWFMGDDMGYLAQANGLQWPTTVTGTLRVKGIKIGLDRVTPIFWS